MIWDILLVVWEVAMICVILIYYKDFYDFAISKYEGDENE